MTIADRGAASGHVSARFGLDRRRAAIIAAVAIGVLSIPAVAVYPGAAWRGLLFCLVSGGLVPLVVVIGHSPFRILIGVFLALGFWAKFVAHFVVGAQLVEPIGAFPGTPAAWDAALGFATAGLAGVWLALVGTSRLRSGDAAAPPPGAGRRVASGHLGIPLLAVSGVLALAVFVWNHHFSILRIGFVPTLELPPYGYAAVAFTVSWGILLWSLALAWWLVEQGRLPPKALAHIATLEGAAAALSMGSRGQMLLHVIAAGLALWHGLHRRGWRIGRREWIEIGAVLVPLFAATLVLVSIDRALAYVGARPLVTAGRTSTRELTAQEVALSVPIELRRLFVLRWVGLDGVLATVASPEPLGAPLLRRALVESPSTGVDAIFQRMARSSYPRSTRFVFMTIPGPVAFAAFGGNWLACVCLMAALVVAGTLLEHLAGRMTANPAVAAVAGVALAYLLVQLNFPRTLLFFAIELVLAAFGLAIVGRLLHVAPFGAGPPPSRRGEDR
ncbi:MAG: hypothetical protein ABIT71_01620 [Vicinamibacteraceae bacterium]